MATIQLEQFRTRQFGSVPYGNQTALHFKLRTNATGAAVASSSSAALAVNDVIELGDLPEGFLIQDSTVIVSTALTAAVTCSLGIKYSDGVDSTLVPQSATMFGTGLVLNATGRLRSTATNELVKLPKAARLILTITGAANAKVGAVDVLIIGEL